MQIAALILEWINSGACRVRIIGHVIIVFTLNEDEKMNVTQWQDDDNDARIDRCLMRPAPFRCVDRKFHGHVTIQIQAASKPGRKMKSIARGEVEIWSRFDPERLTRRRTRAVCRGEFLGCEHGDLTRAVIHAASQCRVELCRQWTWMLNSDRRCVVSFEWAQSRREGCPQCQRRAGMGRCTILFDWRYLLVRSNSSPWFTDDHSTSVGADRRHYSLYLDATRERERPTDWFKSTMTFP